MTPKSTASGIFAKLRSAKTVRLATVSAVFFSATAILHAATPPTIVNNYLPPLPVGLTESAAVTLTLTAAGPIKSIVLAGGTAASSEYSINSITLCTVDGTTVNFAGQHCQVSVQYTPTAEGSLASPRLARNATLLYTDGDGVTYAFGLSGGATKAVGHISPGTLSLYAGLPYTSTNLSPLDNSLGSVTGGYTASGSAAKSTNFDFAPYNAIYASNYPNNGAQPLALDSQGNLYVIDAANYVIHKIDNTPNHIVTTIAGVPQTLATATYAGDGGLATSAKLYSPHAITLDAAGNIYFIDNTSAAPIHQTIRRIDVVTGIITAIAGQNWTGTYNTAGGGTCASGTMNYTCGDGGLASYAYFDNVVNLAVDITGNFYLWGNNVPFIREIDIAKSDINTIANTTTLNSTNGYGGMTIGADGNLYVLTIDSTANGTDIKQFNPTTLAVKIISGTNSTSTNTNNCSITAQLTGFPAANLEVRTNYSPTGNGDLSSDAGGNIYVSDQLCTDGNIYGANYYDSIVRVNVASQIAYSEVISNGGYSNMGVAVSGDPFNADYSYYVDPIAAIPDTNGNIYFTTYNQIGLLSGSAADVIAGYEGVQNDFTESPAVPAVYSNVGNGGEAAPSYTFASGINFVINDAGDSNACDKFTSLSSGVSCNLDISAYPIVAGPISDTLNVVTGGVTQTVTATSTGIAEPEFAISPTSAAFGNQAVNVASAPVTFTISNPGTANLLLTSYFIDFGTGSAAYTVTPGTCLPSGTYTTLAPQQSCTFTVTFKPASAISYAANIYVSTSLAYGDVATLSGTGVATVTAPVAALTPPSLSFSSQTVNTTSAAQNLTLTNSGNATLNISSIALTGANTADFAIATTGTTCGTTLAASATCNIAVTFKPLAATSFTAAVTVTDNSAVTTQVSTLSGTGAGVPQLQFYPSQTTIFAGVYPSGGCTDSGDGGPATAATFCATDGVLQDASGNTYIVDQGLNNVRKVTSSGTISDFAGYPQNSAAGTYSGDGGPAATAGLSVPFDVAEDSSGNVYIADYEDGRVRVVNTAGTISTYAGGASGYFTAGQVPSIALNGPTGLAFDPSGNLYIAVLGSDIVVKVTPSGAATRFAGTTVAPGPIQAGYNGDNIAASTAELNQPGAVASDAAGNIYIAEAGDCRIRKVTASTGIITTVAGNGTCGTTGDGGPATSAEIRPESVFINLAGDILLANGVSVRKVDISGNISTVLGGGTNGSPTFPAPSNELAFNRGLDFARVDNNGSILASGSFGSTGYQIVKAGPNGDLDLGTSTVNTPSAAQTVLFENTGSATLTLSQTTYTATGDFAVTGGTCKGLTTLAPGITCTLTVVFTPAATGPRTGSISVASNSSSGLQSIALLGTGTGVLSIAPTSQAFASTAVNGTSSTLTSVLTNGTTQSIYLSSGSLTDATDFTQSDNCNGLLAPAATCNVTFTFTPKNPGPLSSTYSINNLNTPASPLTVTLSGTGTAAPVPVAALAPTSLSFTNQTVNTTSTPLTLMLSNTGNAILNISSIAITGTNIADFAINAAGTTCGATLAASANCTIAVTFTPASATSFSAAVTVTDNSAVTTQVAMLSGTGTAAPAPVAALAPSSLTFNSQTVNTTSTPLTLMLSNTGNAVLNISSIAITGTNIADFAINAAGTTCGTTLAASANCTIAVSFTPASATTFGAAVTVTDNSAVTTQVAALSGTGTAAPAPVAALAPSSLTFNSQTVNTTSTPLTLMLSNTGNAVLNISSIAITGANIADFAINTAGTTCGTTLAASANCTISVTFTPASATTFGAAVTVTDNSAVTTQVAALSGTGTAVPAPVAALAPSSLTFNSQTVNTTSAPLTLMLSNTGNAILNISSVAITGANIADFAINAAGTTCGTTLAASANCTISVTFTPASATTFSAAVTVTDNSAITTQVAMLSGTGTALAVPIAGLAPGSLSFGNQNLYTTSAIQSFTLSNTGTASLTGISISLTGANSASFAESGSCTSTLAAGSSCTINVTFTPTLSGPLSAGISVTDNASGSPQTATLSGTGVSTGSSFTVAGAPTVQTVNPGAQAVFTINVNPTSGGFSTPVALSVTGLPTGAVATFSPASVTPGTAGASSVLTIQTSAQYAQLSPRSHPFAPAWALLLLPTAWLVSRRRMRRSPVWLAVLLLAGAATLGLSGCSGGYFGPKPQSFTLTVTGAASAIQQSTTVTLNVQ